MTTQVLIAGAGMGGLAAAIAIGRRGGPRPLVLEQARTFDEAGAGIQLGPNATRVLQAWNLGPALARFAAFPQRLSVRSAASGDVLAQMPLGAAALERYGAPYATLHRADLHRILLEGAQAEGVEPVLDRHVASVRETPDRVLVGISHTAAETEVQAVIGADGLWSRVREQVWADGLPVPSGHLAYRTLIAQDDLAPALRSDDVTVWLGPRLHVVAYPVHQSHWQNVVAIVHGTRGGDPTEWDQSAVGRDLLQALGSTCAPLQDLVRAAAAWKLWVLHERAPLKGAQAMARGRVALVGDAAHPMRPYLAQGAGMAIEDAQELGRCLANVGDRSADVPAALRRYGLNRWERCARVQRQAERNGRIFHATGPVQWGRDLSLRLLGERLLDQPWLYR
jgi:salicylate hydroxylase